MVIPGTFISTHEPPEPIEITQKVTKAFIKDVYRLMLGRGEILNLEEYFNNKFGYRMCGKIFDEDLTEIFVERHRAWIKK
ncbi:unnamed protein product [marine sediment metagenome]|uniref:Uncharacterized protein n=1 Tax=marine sediment metagenome TaxID=412755 RepID=X1BMP1_9ZZZZ